jgi:hypothetical protein
VNRSLHFRGKGIVHHAVARNSTLPLKQGRDDCHPVMPTAGGRAGMADMLSTFILDFNDRRRQGLTEKFLNSLLRVHFFP